MKFCCPKPYHRGCQLQEAVPASPGAFKELSPAGPCLGLLAPGAGKEHITVLSPRKPKCLVNLVPANLFPTAPVTPSHELPQNGLPSDVYCRYKPR